MVKRIVVLSTTVILFLPMASSAQSQWSILGGESSSIKLGEQPISPSIRTTATFGHGIRIEPNLDLYLAKKLKENAGWELQASSSLLMPLGHSRFFFEVGPVYSYRNGGVWSKNIWFVKAGLGEQLTSRRNTLQIRGGYRRQVKNSGFQNQVQVVYLQFRSDLPMKNGKGSFRLELEPNLVNYLDNSSKNTWGGYCTIFVGVVFDLRGL